MKRMIFTLWLCIITKGAIGGVLSCQANYIGPGQPWSVIGLEGAYTGFYEASNSFPGLTGMFLANDDGSSNVINQDVMDYTITMSTAASRALAGTEIRGLQFKLHGASSWVDDYTQIIQAGQTTYRGILPSKESNYSGLAIVLGNTGTHSYLGSVEAASEINITATARYLRGNNLYGTSSHTITMNGTAMVTDKLSFPDEIHLGELESGTTNYSSEISASENKNKLAPTFSLISSGKEGIVYINSSPLRPGSSYTPSIDSYKIGIWLPENATPGIHSANIAVSWTCP